MEKSSLNYRHLLPYPTPWLTLYGQNYPCLKQISTDQKMFEPYSSTKRAISFQYRVRNMFCAGCLSSDWLRIAGLSRLYNLVLLEELFVEL